MSETVVVKQTDGKLEDGTQTQATPEATAAAVAKTAADKVTADKAAADAKLLDSNGNPKSEEVLAEEAAAEATATKVGKEDEVYKGAIEKKAKQVEDLIVSAGIDPVNLANTADRETGELSVDHKIKLIEKHGEAVADLIEGNVKKMMQDTRKYNDARDKSVFDQVEKEFKGVTTQKGSDTWKELASWVKDNMDKSTRKEYNKMLSSGGLQAQLAVKEMVTAFKKENDMTISAKFMDGDSGAIETTGGFITRSEYMKQLDVLQKGGHDYDTSPEIAALNKKRMKSMQNGK